MKNHTVTLGGKVYALEYTVDDREEIEDTYKRPDGTPCAMGQLVRDNLVTTGSFRVQATLVWIGVRQHKVTYAKVRDAMAAATKNGGLGEILQPVRTAILASGVLGRVIEMPEPEAEEQVATVLDGPGGKGPAAT